MGVPSFVPLTDLQRRRLCAYLVTVLKPSSALPLCLWQSQPGTVHILSNIIVQAGPCRSASTPPVLETIGYPLSTKA
jgi:hypothetical protein